MVAEDYLKNYSLKAEKFLDLFFENKKALAKKIDPDLASILQVFQNYTKGGKKARGALTVLGYESLGGKKAGAVLPISCGIELFHNFLLIHDDIIDKDAKRRGRPTVHAIYAKARGEHYGNSKAIIVGDVGAFLAYELLLSSDFSKERTLKAVSKLNEFLLKTGYGQLLDIDYDFKKEVTWSDILKVRTYKTAYYTLVMPLTVGAIFAGAEKKKLAAIEKYAVPVGIAFQLADDALGVFGSIKKTGKSNFSDIREGKKTFLYAKALELSKPSEKIFLKRWYGAKDVGSKQASEIKRIIISCGSLDYSQKLATDLVKKGKRNIGQITQIKKYQKILESLADFVVSRQS
ncbi:MAG: Polyprenyl synthetase superfamily [Candidatus Woesebacteria bacterium GW2011_GWA1_45_8]|uniref:Polyprenyl synthetase superfamily n=1 Tax=Candidatus Woesebacteria bacterium GW2011_GWA1_45_8 TaxID=1618559 RepID=A0A0G1Q3R4_9BACT|nr:MAG: Polyprenyl synthetase superfamily [Candidatus Woesebacteria bacterium GW2011_GWA1_45_8]